MATLNCLMCGDLLAAESGEAGLCSRCQREESAPMSLGINALNPSLPLAILLAAVLSAAFYAAGPFLLLRDTTIAHLFLGHGWVPYVCVCLFFCALAVLLLKLPLIARERAALGLQLLPTAFNARIDAADSHRILERIARLTRAQRSMLLVSRVRQAMMRLNQLGTAEKLDDLLRYRADADESAMDSSYAAPKFIIWAIPVLGFVGTVLGISNGVQSFSTLIQNASDLEGLRQSLKGVTYGLGQAFETTMLALCLSLILMLIMSWLQRKEDQLLASIDDYCMEHLLHKVSISAAGSAQGVMSDLVIALRETVQQLREMQASNQQIVQGSAAKGNAAAQAAGDGGNAQPGASKAVQAGRRG